MKKIYSLFILLAFLFCCSASSWAQCDGGTCTITITGTDSYGDGWNGGAITIYQGATLVGTYSCTGSSSTSTFSVCAGPISFSWSPGSFDTEVGFTITDSLGAVLFTHLTATPLSSGVFCNDVACATCPRPLNVNATNITSDSATVTWDGSTTVNTWLYQLSPSSSPSGSWTSTTDTAVVFSGLLANTSYYFFVKAVCSADDTSAAAVLNFRTQCGDNPIPFSEGFENNGTSVPFCWNIWEKGIYDSWGYIYEYPQIYSYDYYAHTGSHSFYIYDYYGPNSLISPRVLLPANQVEVTFWGYFSDYYGDHATLQVGYTTTNDSATAVFHLVENVSLASTYTLYTVDFDTLTTTDSIYVCFRSAGNNGGVSTSVYIYLDDITIRQINNCSQADSLTMVSTASHQVTLSWSDAVGTSWEIAYGPTGFNPDYDTVRVLASTNPFTLTGLSDNVTYDFYVRTVCGTQRGYWSQPITARPNVVDMPLSGTDTAYVCGASIADPGGVSAVVPEYTTSTLVVFPDDSAYTVSLTGSVALGSTDYLYIYEGVGTTGRLLGSYSGNVPSVNVASSIGPLTIYLTTTYNTYDGFIFTTHCDPLPTCTSPYDVQVSNVTGNSALVSWNYANFTTPDYFVITAIDTSEGAMAHYFTAPDTARSFTITGLDQHTYYNLYVQSSCDNGDTSLNAITSFFTYCLSGGEHLVGNETSASTECYLPAYFYGDAVSQQIFDSVDLVGLDTIFGLRFYCTSTYGYDRNIDLYIDSTSRSSFTDITDFEVQADSTRRFSGMMTFGPGWNEIRFDPVFVYDGHSHVVVTFDDNTGTYASSPYWQSTSTTDAKSVYGYSYNGDIDPTDLSTLSNISSYSQGALTSRLNTVFLTGCAEASCVPPNATVASVSFSSVTLSWVAGLDETSWSVEYRQSDSTDWHVHTSSTSFDTAVVSGLLPATAYDFRISSLCGDTTASVIVHVTTSCAPITAIPFTEGFESFTATYSEPATQMCWTRHTNYVSSYSSYYPYVYNYYYHTGSQCLYMYAEDYGTPYNSMIVLPEMAPPADTLTISFYMMGDYTSYYHYTVEVGVLSNPNDTSTFVHIDSVRFMGDDYEWQLCEVSLDSYTGTGHFPAIRTARGSNSFYIDDITVEYFNPCRTPKNLRVFNATTSSVALSFTDTNNVGSYTVVYGTSDSLAGATDTVQSTSTTITLTGLNSATEYHAWVRANCLGGGSKWAEFPALRTLCNPIVVDALNSYEQNFEQGFDSCMSQERLVGSTDWTANTTSSNPIGAYSGGYVAELYNYSRTDQTMLILPSFDFTNLDQGAELTFWHAQVNGLQQDELFVYYRTSPTGEWSLVDSFTTEITAWTQHFVSLPSSNNNAFYQVGLRGVTGGYGVKLDDISVHATPSCTRPTSLVVDTAGSDFAVLSWAGTAPSYQIRYRRVGSLSWSNEYTDSTTITLTGLRGLSDYQCMVRGICSVVDNSNYSDPVYFSTTACASEVDYFNYDTSSYAASTTYWAPGYVNYAYSYSETLVDSAELAGVTEITGFAFNSVAPSSTSFNNCNVYFGYANSSTLDSFLFDSTFVRVYHGSLNFTNPGWNKVLLDSTFVYDGHSTLVVGVFRNNCYSDYNTTYFNGVNKGSAKTIAASNYNSFSPSTANSLASYNKHIDNISPCYMFITCAPVCNAPEITATAATENSVTLSWNSDGNYAQIAYKESSSDTWSDPIDAAGDFYTVTGLNHSTSYDFRLRQDCTESELGTSAWVEITVSTEYVCNVPTDLQMVDVDNAHATFSWTSEPGDSRWEIRVFNNSFEQIYEVSTNPATIDGLTAGNTYHAAIRTLCGPDFDVEGAYSSSIDFSTPICGSVYGVNGEAVNNYVHITWNPGNHASGYYEVQYGRQGYTETEVLGSVITPDTQVYITNLVPNFTYGFRVRSLCGLSWYSDWTTTELVLTTGDPVGIEDAEGQFSCTIYPNPASGSTTISVAGAEGRVDIEVVDVNGRHVATETLECSADCTKQMDVSGLAQGTYFVRIVTAQATTIRKLVIK